MTNSETDLPPFPWRRECPYVMPEQYAKLRDEGGVTRVTLATGTTAWLVTRYDLVRQIINDRRFSSDRAHPSFPYIIPVPQEFKTNASFVGMDPPQHTRHRRIVNAEFTYHRVKAMRPRVEQVVNRCLDAMLAQGPPVDLVQYLSLPVPASIIGDLLGVPDSDQPFFLDRTKMMLRGTNTREERMKGLRDLEDYLRRQIVRLEEQPGDDLLSRLVIKYKEAGDKGGGPEGQGGGKKYDRDEMVSVARLLLNSGHETSASMISLGTLTLLAHPFQLASLKADPSLAAKAAEELLRYLSIADLALNRVALTDVELGGVLIREGDAVITAGGAANRDPSAFDHPDELDIRRNSRHHVSFGYGLHYCLGADLTRLELEVVFSTLFRRIPTIRLAKPAEELPYKDGTIMYGVYEMPVTW